jgi:hypothetical protein
MDVMIRFVSKCELERDRLVREARATYESIFRPTDRVSEKKETQAGHAASGANTSRGDTGRLS